MTRQHRFNRATTEAWAERWPCSTLKGKTVTVELDSAENLIDLAVNPGDADDVDAHELDAFLEDHWPRHK